MIKKAYMQGEVEFEDGESGEEGAASPRNVGHNIYILAHQVRRPGGRCQALSGRRRPLAPPPALARLVGGHDDGEAPGCRGQPAPPCQVPGRFRFPSLAGSRPWKSPPPGSESFHPERRHVCA